MKQKKSRNLLGQHFFLKIQILVTIKIQEIGTDHLGLVYSQTTFHTLYSTNILNVEYYVKKKHHAMDVNCVEVFSKQNVLVESVKKKH